MRRILNILKNSIFALLLLILLFFSLALLGERSNFAGFSSYVVLSGSMSPVFNAGDVVIIRKVNPDSLAKQDIISFNDPNIPGKIITHRITDIATNGNKLVFITKGDANKNEDMWSISSTSVLGKVFFTVPKVGYLINFTKSKPGFIIFILIPGLTIIVSEIISLSRYIKKMEEKAKNHDQV